MSYINCMNQSRLKYALEDYYHQSKPLVDLIIKISMLDNYILEGGELTVRRSTESQEIINQAQELMECLRTSIFEAYGISEYLKHRKSEFKK